LKAVAFNHPPDSPGAEVEAALPQLLGDDLHRGVGIKKAMPNHLANDLVGSARRFFGPALSVPQRHGTVALEGAEQLVVPLFAVAVLLGGLPSAKAHALAVDEHGQLSGDLVVGQDGQTAFGTDQCRAVRIESKHLSSSLKDSP